MQFDDVMKFCNKERIELGNLGIAFRKMKIDNDKCRWHMWSELKHAFPPQTADPVMSHRVLSDGVTLPDDSIMKRDVNGAPPIRNSHAHRYYQTRRRRARDSASRQHGGRPSSRRRT